MASTFANLPKSNQIAIAVLPGLILASLFGWWTWNGLKQLGPDPELRPAFLKNTSQADSLYNQIADLDTQISEQQAVIDRGDAVRAERKQLTDAKSMAEKRLWLAVERGQIRELIGSRARDIDGSIGKVSVTQFALDVPPARVTGRGKQKDLSAEPLNYTIDLKGDLNGLIAYINALETNTRVMMVTSGTLRTGGVAIDPKTNQVSYTPHTATLKVVTYYYSNDPAKDPK